MNDKQTLTIYLVPETVSSYEQAAILSTSVKTTQVEAESIEFSFGNTGSTGRIYRKAGSMPSLVIANGCAFPSYRIDNNYDHSLVCIKELQDGTCLCCVLSGLKNLAVKSEAYDDERIPYEEITFGLEKVLPWSRV